MRNKKIAFPITLLFLFCMLQSYSFTPAGDLYQIKIYQLTSKEQESKVDHFLQQAYIPALHRAGIKAVGVFKPLANDTSSIRKIYLLIPFSSADQLVQLSATLQKDEQ